MGSVRLKSVLNNITNTSILDRSQPGITVTAPSTVHKWSQTKRIWERKTTNNIVNQLLLLSKTRTVWSDAVISPARFGPFRSLNYPDGDTIGKPRMVHLDGGNRNHTRFADR